MRILPCVALYPCVRAEGDNWPNLAPRGDSHWPWIRFGYSASSSAIDLFSERDAKNGMRESAFHVSNARPNLHSDFHNLALLLLEVCEQILFTTRGKALHLQGDDMGRSPLVKRE
jgi:hypothetical protein